MIEIQLDGSNERPAVHVPADGVIRLVMNPSTPISTALNTVASDLLVAIQGQLYSLFADRSVVREYQVEEGNPHSRLIIRYATPTTESDQMIGTNHDQSVRQEPSKSP